ncbi:MAG: molybdopterin molybdenumtransferase MoeA [Puniceicoccaceae bacterium]|nr:MAG: molybdopterin molybdenumtransferase MoeA [Puniceicoccaceae bacterium]
MTPNAPPLSVAEAWAVLASAVAPAEARREPLQAALGRVLAESIRADADQPPLDQSAIDGFAVAAGSGPGRFTLGAEWLPGRPPAEKPPGPGIVCRVFTGTPLPADCELVMLEDAEVDGEAVRTTVASSPRLIRRRGGSLRRGDPLLEAGVVLGPGEIALLASAGVVRPRVIPAASVLHLTTGSEIVPAEATAAPWQIRDSNGPLVRSLLPGTGCTAVAQRHVGEGVEELTDAVGAVEPHDFLLVSGGSSVGRHDNTAAALEALGFEIVFRRINVRPGKPLVFARRGRRFAFGIPGNPVSHFAVFHAFIAPALRAFAGLPAPAAQTAGLVGAVEPSGDPREVLWPGRLRLRAGALEVHARPWVHSGDLAALRGIDALIHLSTPAGAPAGETVSILPCLALPPATT